MIEKHVAPMPADSSAVPLGGRESFDTRVDSLVSSVFQPPSTLVVSFRDGQRFELHVDALDMDNERIQWPTATASATGDFMIVNDVKGKPIPIEARTLRYLVDAPYAKKCDEDLKSLQLTKEELAEFVRDNPPPPEWYAALARDVPK